MASSLSKKWIDRFTDLAKTVSSWSKDPSTKVGAVITKGNRIISVGYNGPPPELPDEWALSTRDIKVSCTIHAEHNAIEFSKKSKLKGCSLFITHPPCDRCATLIVKKKIKEVYFFDLDADMRKRWNCDAAEEILCRGNVKIVKIGIDSVPHHSV